MGRHFFTGGICLICCGLTIFFPSIGISGETYRFQKMFPVYEQPWYFVKPSGLATDNEDFVYIADSDNDRIQKFTADGQFISQWKNIDDKQFYSVNGIAVDRDGFIYAADTQNNRVVKFTPEGELIYELKNYGTNGKPFVPYGIAISFSGDVYVTDTRNNSVLRFTTEGRFISRWGGGGGKEFDWPYEVAVDMHGFVYVVDSNNQQVKKFTKDGGLILNWGQEGNGNGQFNKPIGVAIDQKGYVYVTDHDNHSVQKFTSEGRFVTRWGAYGKNDGEFDSPDGITANNNGYIYVSDYNNNRIQIFTEEGRFVSRWGPGAGDSEFNFPEGIALNEKENTIYVADTENNRIQKFNAEGRFIAKWGAEGQKEGEFYHPKGIAVSSEGSVYVSDTRNNRIQQFTLDGQYVNEWRGFNSPYGLTLDKNGNVYVADTDNNRIQKFTSTGTFLTEFCKGCEIDIELNTPYGIASDDENYIYIADTLNQRILIFDNIENTFRSIELRDADEEPVKPYDIDVDNDKNLFILDALNHRALKFNVQGELIAEWGERGNNPNQMRYPGGCAISSDGTFFYVTDTNNHRIQIFQKELPTKENKAIILAGGGPYPGNNLWNATRVCANFAYRTLIYRGFSKDDIRYLSPETDLDLDTNGQPDDVYGPPTKENLKEAITWVSKNVGDVVLYFVDHGAKGKFRLNEAEILSVEELNSWLGFPQSTLSGRIFFVYDACNASSFISNSPLNDGHNILIASSGLDEDAYFISQGALSFSQLFWMRIFSGDDVEQSFKSAKEIILNASDFQTPIVQGNGAGVYIGNGRQTDHDAPNLPSENVVIDNNAGTISVSMDHSAEITCVWAIMSPIAQEKSGVNTPVVGLPSVDLMPVAENQYEGASEILKNGDNYQIDIFSKDKYGNIKAIASDIRSGGNHRVNRAIIASDGSYANMADMAFNALVANGYDEASIVLLNDASQNKNEGGLPDGLPTLRRIKSAIEGSEKNTKNLFIYLAGTGEQEGIWINESQMLKPVMLNEWLDDFQSNISANITIIIDADHSGNFLLPLAASGEKERIIISSASFGKKSSPLPESKISFSYFFWNSLMKGADIQTAFNNARDSMDFLSNISEGNGPQLDDNGNGIGNERSDGRLAMNCMIGDGIRRSGNEPVLKKFSNSSQLSVGGKIFIDATSVANAIEKVTAAISPIGNFFIRSDDSGMADLSLSSFGLSPDENGKYAIETKDSDFPYFGTYQIKIFAEDSDGNISFSETATIFQPAGKDLYEPDDAPQKAGFILVNDNDPQQRNFHEPNDKDWLQFYGASGQVYALEATPIDTSCNLVMELHDSQGSILEPINDCRKEWRCPADSVYYIQIYLAEAGSNEESTGYEFKIYTATAGFPGILTGAITDAITRTPIKSAKIKTEANACLSLPHSGQYYMSHESGVFNMTVEAPGYRKMEALKVEIGEGGATIKNFQLTPTVDAGQNVEIKTDQADSVSIDEDEWHASDVEKVDCFIQSAYWKEIR